MATTATIIKHGDKIEYCPKCGFFDYDDDFRKNMTLRKFKSRDCPHCKQGKTVLASYHENPTSFCGIVPLVHTTPLATVRHRSLERRTFFRG